MRQFKINFSNQDTHHQFMVQDSTEDTYTIGSRSVSQIKTPIFIRNSNKEDG
jgi:hypothetical protein